jgi:hypothetical protein
MFSHLTMPIGDQFLCRIRAFAKAVAQITVKAYCQRLFGLGTCALMIAAATEQSAEEK